MSNGDGEGTRASRRSHGRKFQRTLGAYGEDPTGPLFFVVGGMHGNEPAGLLAAERVLAELHRRRPAIRGRLVVVAGNLRALFLGQRYIESDLNRIWREEIVARVDGQEPTADSPEQHELRELLAEFRAHVESQAPPPERVVFLDLHTTSAGGAPFQCMGDTLQNRHIAFELPVPLILGLEEVIHGSFLEYVGERGYAALAVEGGQHEDPRTLEHHEAGIWTALVAAGCLAQEGVPDLERHRARLSAASRGIPRVVEIVHRYGVADDDGFEMLPGYYNFCPVKKGEVLARDHRGEIRCPQDGLLLLPRYQGQGNDGFFVAREVRAFWLQISAALRRVRADRVLRFLPGVRRDDPSGNRLVVNRHIARLWPVQVFHLFGFRRIATRPDGHLTFERRREGQPWPH